MKPVHIFIDGQELGGWTEMTLSRSKKDLTGSLSVSMFFTYMPERPVAINATKNKEITVYIGGQLAFTGKVDKRIGSGVKRGQTGSDDNPHSAGEGDFSRSAQIGADEYTVKLTARGKTKYLIDSSHQHPTTNMMKPTNKEVIEKLVQPWGLDLDWKAKTFKLDKWRFRDGQTPERELERFAVQNSHFMYETRDGKLRVTDDTGREEGEPLILGVNIMSFSAEQSEDQANKKIKVKGQRTEENKRGRAAVLNVEKEIEDKWVEGNTPLTIQHYGDASPEGLERRANFETNIRSSQSKTLSIDVFHVQSSNGEPWDIGTLHYCEVPPEGIFDVFEVTELTYEVQNDDTIKTSLTLSPPPLNTAGSGGQAGQVPSAAGLTGLGQFVADAGSLVAMAAQGAARRAQAGVTFGPGQYPMPWSGPDVVMLQPPKPQDLVGLGAGLLSSLLPTDTPPAPALPPHYESEEPT